MRTRKVLVAFGILFSSVLFHFRAYAVTTAETYGVIVNLAGRQRMLTQKMMKQALLIYAGIGVEDERKHLEETMALFAKTLRGLRHGDISLGLPPARTAGIQAELDKASILFKEMEPILARIVAGEAPSRDAVVALAEQSSSLLESMHAVVEMYEREARNALTGEIAFLGTEINLAGRQRMLSQKMAKEALLVYLDIDRQRYKGLLRETYTLFERTLRGLKYGDGDLGLPGAQVETIAEKLDGIIRMWTELKPVFERYSDIMLEKVSREDMEMIATMSTQLLAQMDETVRMYEGLSK